MDTFKVTGVPGVANKNIAVHIEVIVIMVETATERRVFQAAQRKGGVAATLAYAFHAAGYGEEGARQALAAIAEEQHAIMPPKKRP